MAAACVFAFGYMRDFGGQADNPNSSQSWEAQYQKLFGSAKGEELRKLFNIEQPQISAPSTIIAPIAGDDEVRIGIARFALAPEENVTPGSSREKPRS